MNETFSRFIQLVIQNNPTAISQKLMAIGVLNQEMEDAEYIRQVLYDQVRRIGEDGSLGDDQISISSLRLNISVFDGLSPDLNPVSAGLLTSIENLQYSFIIRYFFVKSLRLYKKVALLPTFTDIRTVYENKPNQKSIYYSLY